MTKTVYKRASRGLSRVMAGVAGGPPAPIAEALAAVGIPCILYTGTWTDVVLVRDSDRDAACAVLRRTPYLVGDEWGGQTPARLLRGALPARRSSYWELREHVQDRPSVRIEIWSTSDDAWVPQGRSLIGRPVPAPVGVLDRRRVEDLPPDARTTRLDIDVVYTWVDGADPQWQRRRDSWLGRAEGAVDASASRYLDRDELRYSLRSLRAYAPWVRRIYLVTDQQRPAWLVGDDITVVDHRELFPDPGVLPTFNSHAIETVLHRIDGLSEHFVYFNDDVFLSRPVPQHIFFSPGGRARVSFSAATIDYTTDEPYARAWRNMAELVEARYGVRPLHLLRHTPHPMLRSEMARLEQELPEVIARVRGQRFRGEGDVPPVALSRYTMLRSGAAFERPYPYLYLNLARPDAVAQLRRLARESRRFETFCLNDTTDAGPVHDAVVAALQEAFPAPAPWERA